MKRAITSLSDQSFDVLIIGGGIFGAGIARDAALRGLRVALIDKADFASGTSSCSSKLIHGGFRYLEQYSFGLVAEACRERRILLQIAPHLVRPLPFILPVYENSPRPLWKIRLGMAAYDLLALYRNLARHRFISAPQTHLQEPALSTNGLRGAIEFYDCQEDDARFCLENIFHAADLGAVCANYCQVESFITKGEQLIAARVRDRLANTAFEIAARVFINAAGPWVTQIANLVPDDGTQVALSPTKGVHLVLPRLTGDHAIAFQSRQDGRILFALPWGDTTLVGTTDTNFAGNPDDLRAEPADIDYLLTEIRALMPARSVNPSDIITTFTGVRALPKADATRPSARSRECRLVPQGRNFFSIIGGKYTTYRSIAAQALNLTYRLLHQKPTPCQTAITPLPQHRPNPTGEKISDSPAVYASDIHHACEYEMAMTLTDVMRRRTSLALSRHGDPQTAGRVAALMAPIRGWNEEQTRSQLAQYTAEWKRNQP